MEQMTCVKYLGLKINCNVNWKKHVHEVGKNISRATGILSKLRHFITDDNLNQLYHSLVLSFPYLTL